MEEMPVEEFVGAASRLRAFLATRWPYAIWLIAVAEWLELVL